MVPLEVDFFPLKPQEMRSIFLSDVIETNNYWHTNSSFIPRNLLKNYSIFTFSV